MRIIDSIKDQVPFELKPGASLWSVVFATIIAGLLGKLGEMILEGLLNLMKPFLPVVGEWFKWLLTVSFEVNLIWLIIFAIVLFPIYRYSDKFLLKRGKDKIIFIDKFDAVTWNLNFWKSHNPDKTNRIENSSMVFEATESELVDPRKEFGAYFNLRKGIHQGEKYEVICRVRSDENTTMQFRLWLHDAKPRGAGNSIKTEFRTPSTKFEEVKLEYTANETEAMRIHLHCKAGAGKIIVDEVVVRKI